MRDTRPAIAEKKAELYLSLGRLCMRVPPAVRDGSIQTVRRRKSVAGKAARIVRRTDASVNELASAIEKIEAAIEGRAHASEADHA
jgi:hypothetical protein